MRGVVSRLQLETSKEFKFSFSLLTPNAREKNKVSLQSVAELTGN